nr:hypothetical protein [uncultured Flavobacterium sp.]
MKNFRKIISVLILLILISSCEKKQTELEFEKSVMTEIFPSLVDSICVDCRILFLPMQLGKSIYDKNNNYIGRDTSNIKAEREKWKKELVKIKNDTSKIIIALAPIRKIRGDVNSDFEKHFPKIKLYVLKEEMDVEYIFDFKNIKLNNKFELKNLSEFPKERGAIWNTKYNFVFSGVLDFSRIQFDKDKRFGVLDAGFGCGSKFGQGSRIYIKKVNNKWVIDKIEGTWVS